MSHQGKLIVFTAPSGSGKTTIVKHILKTFPETAFSVSGTTRKRRPHEVHGIDYYYLSVEKVLVFVHIFLLTSDSLEFKLINLLSLLY